MGRYVQILQVGDMFAGVKFHSEPCLPTVAGAVAIRGTDWLARRRLIWAHSAVLNSAAESILPLYSLPLHVGLDFPSQ